MSYASHQTYSAFQEQLKTLLQSLSQSTQGLACVYGSSEVLMEYAIAETKSHFSGQDFQVTSIEAGSWLKTEFLLDQANLFEPTNLYIVTRCENIRTWPQWFKKTYPKGVVPHAETHKIVFMYHAERPPEALIKELKKHQSPTVSCYNPWPNDFPKILRDLASRLKIPLAPDAVEALLDANGFDLIKHKHEIQKLSFIYARELPLKEPLTRAMIAPHLGMLRAEESFKIDRLLSARSWDKAQCLVLKLLEEGEKPLSILGIISYHCRNAYLIESARVAGLSADQIQRATGLTLTVIKSHLQNPLKPNLRAYKAALSKCRQADFAFKSSKFRDDLVLAQIIEAMADVNSAVYAPKAGQVGS
jgi:DNA polymerase III delta subunit